MIVIRACEGLEELEACVQLQVETWGYDATDIMPRKAFLVMQKAGGQVMGAFDTELHGDEFARRCKFHGWIRFVFAGRKSNPRFPKASRWLICTRTCWRSRRDTATGASERG